MTSTPRSRRELSPDAAEALAREAEMGYDTDSGDSIGKILLATTDATTWARLFKEQFGDVAPDEATMLTWFANALETGRNQGRKETCPHEDTFSLDATTDCCRTCGTLLDAPPTLEEHFKAGFDEVRE